jgi:hypothetical protein
MKASPIVMAPLKTEALSPIAIIGVSLRLKAKHRLISCSEDFSSFVTGVEAPLVVLLSRETFGAGATSFLRPYPEMKEEAEDSVGFLSKLWAHMSSA